MRVQELDPKKRYLVSIDNADLTQDDLERLKVEIKKHCLDAVVVVGADISVGQSFYGLYCDQCATWYKRKSGELVFYPAPEITNAMLNDRLLDFYADHLWKVQEFGKEEYVSRDRLPANSKLCPYHEG